MRALLVSLLCLSAALAAAQGSDPLIINGSLARVGQFPWMVLVGGCSASILNKRTVILAAHCIGSSPPSRLWVGMVTDAASKGVEYQVASAVRHPEHSGGGPNCPRVAGCDIAILKTTKDIQFNDKVQPIRLWLSEEPPVGTGVTIMGFGQDGQGGRYGTLRYASNALTKAGCVTGAICTPRTPNSIYYGDSGGPLVYKRGSEFFLLGINAVITASTARYANVARHYNNFIKANL